jgi:phage repressor protein C with HTH and peptisase S24 domain
MWTSMTTVVDDIKLIGKLLEWSGDNAAQVAAKIGVANTTINRHANGTAKFSLGRATVSKLKEAYPEFPGFTSDRHSTPQFDKRPDISDRQPTHNVDSGETVDVISVDLSLSMGPGTIVEEFPEEVPVKFDLASLRRITRTPPQRIRLIRGIGESMMPTLQSGDQIMIDLNERSYSRIDGIYWVNHFGAHGIKRLRAVGRGRMLIVSDNPAVNDQEVDAEDLLIHGRAIWVAREL